MTALCKGVRCAANGWTEIASGKASVLVKLRQIGHGYVATGAAVPGQAPDRDAAPGTAAFDFLSVSNAEPLALSFADTTTKVYFWAAGRSIDVETVTE